MLERQSDPMLELQAVEAGYGGIVALRGIDLRVQKGTITCLVGPNGAGKTTTMASIMGLVRPRKGSVRFKGQEVSRQETSRIVRHGMTLVPENRLVFPDMRVDENLECGAFHRSDAKAIKSDIEATLDRFPSLRNRRAQFAGSLSGGEQQMLAIGRALMSRPELLLMDEPSLGLAPKIVAEIFRIVTQLKQEGLTIFLVEQNVSAALTVADYFYVMERGSVIFAGTPDELKRNDVIANTYLGLH